MIIYEVNLEVHAEIADDFGDWLRGHIREMLELPGFRSADWYRDDDHATGCENWCVRYLLASRADLEHYLEEHAPRMREDGTARFGDRFFARRRVLEPISSFPEV
jgi:quinol monooxygenase YgiN